MNNADAQKLAKAVSFNPAESIGPVAAAFFEDRSTAACIMGPIGSAKTSVSLINFGGNAARTKCRGCKIYEICCYPRHIQKPLEHDNSVMESVDSGNAGRIFRRKERTRKTSLALQIKRRHNR